MEKGHESLSSLTILAAHWKTDSCSLREEADQQGDYLQKGRWKMMVKREIHTAQLPPTETHRVLKRDIFSLNGTETKHTQQAIGSLH